ncbi:MAG: type IV pilus twitching motility protein PilT [Planctomycetes bacterium]|nr:type IV pilus twitching motility protein PilT [Planctomycetota bacterium]
MDLKKLFSTMVNERASDLFIKVGVPPAVRVAGKVRSLEFPPITTESAHEMLNLVADARARRLFDDGGEADCAYELAGVGRFRVNVFRQRGHTGFVFRLVNASVPTLEELRLPAPQLKKLGTLSRGLVLVTGIAGSGKSTTLASMLSYVNENYQKHIITIEDPIEYIFTDKKSLIEQRELGIDTQSFAGALKYAMRESPDIIMIGEMRDLETMDAAINAAETGHLVLSTLHTISAMQTVERIINMYPPHQHAFLREQLAMVLEGVVSMRLIPTKDGRARVPAAEIMMATPTVRELLYAGKTREIYKALKEGSYFGTQTFNQALKDLLQKDIITVEEALANADAPDELKLEIRGIQKGSRPQDFTFEKKA